MRFLLYLVTTLFIVSACCKLEKDQRNALKIPDLFPDSTKTLYAISPLDTILSDKIANDFMHVTRSNNFHSLLGMNRRVFLRPSKIYKIILLNSAYAAIVPKNHFTHARNTSVIVAFDQSGEVVNYFILNDYNIQDVSYHRDGIAVVATDYENCNEFWKRKYNVQAIHLDGQLNERFTYETASWEATDLPFYAEASLCNEPDRFTFRTGVITACHICYTVVEVVLNDRGECIDVLGNQGSARSRSLTQEELKRVFFKVRNSENQGS